MESLDYSLSFLRQNVIKLVACSGDDSYYKKVLVSDVKENIKNEKICEYICGFEEPCIPLTAILEYKKVNECMASHLYDEYLVYLKQKCIEYNEFDGAYFLLNYLVWREKNQK